MRGLERQQVTRVVDDVKSKIYDSNILSSDGMDKYRMFPSRIFNFMSTFNCEFDVELRYLESKNTLAFKAFGQVKEENGDVINIYVASPESTSQIMSNFDIVE
jgi:hypothetical protein